MPEKQTIPEKNRVTRLSTRWLLPFKVTIFAVYTGLFAAFIYMSFSDFEVSGLLLNVVPYSYIFYWLLMTSAKLKHVEYDDEFLFVKHKRQEVLIPLENVKSVDIKSLGGVYRIDLYFEDLVGDHFYFKPSLLYPLNHKSKDRLVDLLQDKIDAAKRKRTPLPSNALRS
jgi:hypothetical protein